MAHAHQRLLERTVAADSDRAYTLLRDRKLLARFLDAAATKLQHTSARLALPLRAGKEPPHLLVERDGTPVTCLGSGMALNVPVVPWELVHAYLGRLDRLLKMRRARAALRDEETVSQVNHGLNFGHRMTRPDWDLARLLGPVLEKGLDPFLDSTADLLDAISRHAPHPPPLDHTAQEVLWGQYVAMGHALLAMGPTPRGITIAFSLAPTNDVFLSARANWLLVNHPRQTMDRVRTLLKMGHHDSAWAGAAALSCIIWRFEWHRREALELFREVYCLNVSVDPKGERMAELLVKDRPLEAELLWCWLDCVGLGQRRHMEVPGLPAGAEAHGGRMLGERVDWASDQHALGTGNTTWKERLVQAVPFMEPHITAWDPLRDAHREPLVHPSPPGALSADAAARNQAWRVALSGYAGALGMRQVEMAAVFSCAPLDALIPQEEVDPLLSMAQGRVTLMEKLPRVAHEQRMKFARQARSTKTVGRNEPCPCGSGKKAKKCCHAA